jgi:hypothetical protein
MPYNVNVPNSWIAAHLASKTAFSIVPAVDLSPACMRNIELVPKIAHDYPSYDELTNFPLIFTR